MSAEMNKYVLDLLETYQDRERLIAVLRYELAHPARVTDAEQIEAMTYARGEGIGRTNGRVSNKTLYIALNYEEQAEQENTDTANEIAEELFSLEQCQRKLRYYISLLEQRQSEVIQFLFLEGRLPKEVAEHLGVTYRTVDRIKRAAIESLAKMYAYSDRFKE